MAGSIQIIITVRVSPKDSYGFFFWHVHPRVFWFFWLIKRWRNRVYIEKIDPSTFFNSCIVFSTSKNSEKTKIRRGVHVKKKNPYESFSIYKRRKMTHPSIRSSFRYCFHWALFSSSICFPGFRDDRLTETKKMFWPMRWNEMINGNFMMNNGNFLS